jgi:hypothetical protein
MLITKKRTMKVTNAHSLKALGALLAASVVAVAVAVSGGSVLLLTYCN